MGSALRRSPVWFQAGERSSWTFNEMGISGDEFERGICIKKAALA
jgi:hypothetical protein